MVTADGSFSIHWETELDELQLAAAKAQQRHVYVQQGHEEGLEPREGSTRFLANFEWVRSAFDELREIPSPKHSQALAADMEQITGGNDMDDVSDRQDVENFQPGEINGGLTRSPELAVDFNQFVTGWEGAGADSFNAFISKVPAVVESQVIVAKFLGVTARANAILLRCARQDAEQIIAHTIAALESDGGELAISVLLSIAGAVKSIVTGSLALKAGAKGMELVNAGFSVVTGIDQGVRTVSDMAASDNAGQNATIAGSSPELTLSNMCDAIKEVSTALRDGEDKLKREIDKNLAIMRDPEIRYEFVAPRPNAFVKYDDFRGFRPSPA